jgi:hypothetical protein
MENIDSFRVFEAVLRRNPDTEKMALNICFKDIALVKPSEIVGADIIFSFWFGIPPAVRGRIIYLASTSNATEFICTSASGENCQEVLSELNQYHAEPGRWTLRHSFTTQMMSSGRGCTVYIFEQPPISSDVMQKRNLDLFLVYETDLLRLFKMAQQDRGSRLQSKQHKMIARELLETGILLTEQCIRVLALCENGASGFLVQAMQRQDQRSSGIVFQVPLKSLSSKPVLCSAAVIAAGGTWEVNHSMQEGAERAVTRFRTDPVIDTSAAAAEANAAKKKKKRSSGPGPAACGAPPAAAGTLELGAAQKKRRKRGNESSQMSLDDDAQWAVPLRRKRYREASDESEDESEVVVCDEDSIVFVSDSDKQDSNEEHAVKKTRQAVPPSTCMPESSKCIPRDEWDQAVQVEPNIYKRIRGIVASLDKSTKVLSDNSMIHGDAFPLVI